MVSNQESPKDHERIVYSFQASDVLNCPRNGSRLRNLLEIIGVFRVCRPVIVVRSPHVQRKRAEDVSVCNRVNVRLCNVKKEGFPYHPGWKHIFSHESHGTCCDVAMAESIDVGEAV